MLSVQQLGHQRFNIHILMIRMLMVFKIMMMMTWMKAELILKGVDGVTERTLSTLD